MSRTLDIHSASSYVVCIAGRPIVCQGGTPPSGAVGIAPGCIWFDTSNNQRYRNDGTSKSATWTLVPKTYKETTGVAEAAFVQGSGSAVNDNSTFGGYTLQQVVKALQLQGLLT